MRMRVMGLAAVLFVLGLSGTALAQSGETNSGQNTSAGGSSASTGNQQSSVSIQIEGPASVGSVQGAVAGGGSASGSSGSSSGGSASSSSSSEAASAGASSPSAVDGGVVSSGFELPALELQSQPAARSSTPLLTWVGVALIVVGFTVLYLRLPHGRSA